jgi:hypothetical protein
MNAPNTTKIDAIEVYFERPGEKILFRPRIYSKHYGRMVPISGDAALQTTAIAAFDYARQWLWGPS